jgi:hypothetical protein
MFNLPLHGRIRARRAGRRMVYEAKIDELHGSFALDLAIQIGDHTLNLISFGTYSPQLAAFF